MVFYFCSFLPTTFISKFFLLPKACRTATKSTNGSGVLPDSFLDSRAISDERNSTVHQIPHLALPQKSLDSVRFVHGLPCVLHTARSVQPFVYKNARKRGFQCGYRMRKPDCDRFHSVQHRPRQIF